ncbi:hypothetical protein M514_11154 [Trichuris suis]|uniref:Archease domain-containing protein n=1 Tax=Trichuris suis TaxID=68888 RepID=A0A085LSN1_9BILA|nr:hypothetical protein M513_11154 [Trichuris suis]KFD65718.1 hypothetical protein M514_11154 [Trichuris suis]
MYTFSIMDCSNVEAVYTYDIEASGDDMISLVFHFLDEWLYAFCAEPYFVAMAVRTIEFDKEQFYIRARGWGESFDLKKHTRH